MVVYLTGCAGTKDLKNFRPEVDLSPVGCGYKWFQSGYSPTVHSSCDADRSTIREAQIALARSHAWEVAENRCPDSCPPRELADSVEAEDRYPDGVCRDGYTYFTTRVFFQCGD